MPKKCEVPFCKEIGAHLFDDALRKLWLKAIRRKNFKPENNSRLCRNHFLESDYQKTSSYTGTEHQHRYLKKNAVPSVFSWNTKDIKPQAQERESRLRARNMIKSLFESSEQPSTSVSTLQSFSDSTKLNEVCTSEILNIGSELCIETEKTKMANISCGTQTEQTISIDTGEAIISCGTQTSSILRMFSTDQMLTDDESVHFYTGLENYAKFHLVLSTLLPMANNLKYRWSQVVSVPVEDQFLILLIKLRRNKPDIEISKLFNISKTEVSNIIVTWIHFVSDIWSLIDIWPSRDLVDYYMPKIFKYQSGSTRIIIDATEIPIEKPSNPTAQRATFSSYKHTNTLKFLVAATPDGLLSYCSPGYGGATSDRQVIERSHLIDMCDSGDSIMADRGFNVQDLFAHKNININIPTFLKGKSQLPGILVKQDRKSASAH